jgi:hypothetical protein
MFQDDLTVLGSRYRDRHSGVSGPAMWLRQRIQAVMHPRWALMSESPRYDEWNTRGCEGHARDRSREIGPDLDVGASDHHQEDGR